MPAKYRNLLESVAQERQAEEAKNLIERVANGEVLCDLGTLRESIGSDFFSALTADLTHKRAMKGFLAVPCAEHWRKVVTVVGASDFKFQNAIRTAGYASLESVPENGPYKIKTITDEKARWKLAKYGNMESWSLEAMANDELGRLGRASERMGGAAMRTLVSFVFETLIAANPTCTYDSTTLFHANHANDLGASKALNPANLEAAWAKMRTQTGLGSEKLDIRPRFLLVHPDEEVLANTIVNSTHLRDYSAAAGGFGEANFWKGRLDVIACPFLATNPDAWYIIADPASFDTIEVGFYKGMENPETFVEAKNSGYEFEMDAFRTKTRFIFGGTVLDHRGFVRANV